MIQRNKRRNNNPLFKAKNKDFQKEKFDRKAFIKDKQAIDKRQQRKDENNDDLSGSGDDL